MRYFQCIFINIVGVAGLGKAQRLTCMGSPFLLDLNTFNITCIGNNCILFSAGGNFSGNKAKRAVAPLAFRTPVVRNRFSPF
jgi:hypothetical protein